ncbi:nucleoside-diphosphate kinase [Dethiobacter alkaliphilus]|uniref:nucleoside-diphosphate kinase n=1 Tax=Dethiobacter alkaliphilus TaxID=427926 RepID=UPI0022265620|nr:nucleoside-diphosphate kinase [Dethiobacter alkaliphilus]MCW3489560.1 nucleoside-diphosphate kinase [Dethiobacter alkaliphilus]
MERTYVMVKPDGVQRNLTGEIISRFEKKGFQLVGLKLMQITPELAGKHYGEHEGKPFYGELIDFITSGPVVAMVWQGQNVVSVIRNMMGKTNPAEAAPGTIRGDYAVFMGNNVVHGSDSPESAEREINLFFSPEELVDYKKATDFWLYGK